MATNQSIMCSEMMRYSTFCGFHSPAGVWPSRLARDGFYHSSSCGHSQVVCFNCGLKVDVRSLVNEPLVETHKRLSPNCSYATASSGNQTTASSGNQTSHSLVSSASTSLQSGSLQGNTTQASNQSYSNSQTAQTCNQSYSGLQTQYSFSGGAGFDTSPPPLNSSGASVPILSSGTGEQQNLHSILMGLMDELPSVPAGLYDNSGLTQSSELVSALLGGPADMIATDGEPESLGDTRPITSEPHNNTDNASPSQQVTSASTPQAAEKRDSAPVRTVGFSDLGIIVEKPKRQDMAMFHRRLETLENWVDGHRMTQSNESVAEAGFYYAGYSDCCRCFYCGGGLKNWTESDVPWIEHARWFKTCPFVRTSKGTDFIDAVQSLAQTKEIITMDDVANKMNDGLSSQILPSDVLDDKDMSDIEDEPDLERNMCKICLDKEISVLYVPCGHLVTCSSCAPTMKKCPVCRQTIRGQVRVQMDG